MKTLHTDTYTDTHTVPAKIYSRILMGIIQTLQPILRYVPPPQGALLARLLPLPLPVRLRGAVGDHG